jgi:hypothetical protein
LSPDGTRLAQLAVNSGRLGLSAHAVTVSTSDGTILSDVTLRSGSFSLLAFVDGCSDTASCYCRADVDCEGNFCATGTCEGTEGCRYEDNPCFDGALCVLATAATTTTTTLPTTTTTLPGFLGTPSCDRIFQRLGRLSEGVRERLVAGVSLQGTPAELRRAARRAERAVKKRIRAELLLALNPKPLPRSPSALPLAGGLFIPLTTRQCVGQTDLGAQLDIIRRLRRLRRDPGVCPAARG